MMGFYEDLIAYKLFDLVKQEIIYRRDVVLDEKALSLTLLNSSSSLLSSDTLVILGNSI
jgi:hypothetical protein